MRKGLSPSLSFSLQKMIAHSKKALWTTSLFLLFTLLFASYVSAQANKIDPRVAKQIQSLMDEKASRTPAQQKMSSQLIYSFKMRNGQRITAEVASLEVDVEKDTQGRIKVELDAVVTPQLLNELRALGCDIIVSTVKYGSILTSIPVDKLELVAEMPAVKHLTNWTAPVNNSEKRAANTKGTNNGINSEGAINKYSPELNKRAEKLKKQLDAAFKQKAGNGRFFFEGSVTSEADATHKAALARDVYGTDGTGVKIGVLSNGVTGFAAAIATGDLPPFTILAGQAGTGSEGWAMMELIHDLAPGAELFYATANPTQAQFAQNILDLRAAGCDIIVDDISYFAEGVFQDDNVARAVNTVTASGALYFSSAGNSGNENDNTSGVWEGDFVDGGASAAPLPLTGTLHSYTGGVLFNTLTLAGRVTLKWSDPLGQSANDYDFFATSANGLTLAAAGTTIQNGDDNPYEDLGNRVAGQRLYILKKTGAEARALHLNTNRGLLTFHTPGVIYGHNAAASAYTVAATPTSVPFGGTASTTGPYPNPFNAGNKVEGFSSDGPRRIFYNPDGSPITPGNILFSTNGGTVLQKPDITAGDGAVTTTPGFIPFFGTSAAAPHAAAIAALIKSKIPGITPAQIRTALINSAIDIETPGFDRDAGAGIIMAFEALQAAGAAAVSNVSFGTVTAAEVAGNGNGIIEPGDQASITIQLKDESPVASTNVNAVLTTSTPNVVIIQNSAAYGDIPGNGSAVNTATPYLIRINPQVPCGTIINFTLTVTYGGGGVSPKTFNFTVTIGAQGTPTITATLGTPPPTGVGYVSNQGTQTNRLNRNGIVSGCGSPKATPVIQEAAPGTAKAYHAYTFTNNGTGSQCVTVSLSGAAAVNLYTVTYNNNGYVPASPLTNYLADFGSSANSLSYSFTAPPGQQFTVVVHEVLTGGGIGTAYNLNVDLKSCVAPPVIINASSPVVITAENAVPANNTPDPGETVTLNLPLINNGSGNTTNLVATLLPTGGVTNPSGPQNYGVVVGGGSSVAKPYTFTAAGNCGDNITLTLALQDGATDMGTISYTLRLGSNVVSAPITFANTTPILIPGTGTGAAGGAPANPYPSTINVSGLTGATSKITIGLKQFNHTFPDDVGVLLVSPTGQKMIIMSEAGNDPDAVNIDLVLDDAAATALPATAAIASGTYKPTNITTAGDAYTAPAPAAPYLSPAPAGTATLASAFNGLNPNGTWSLYVIDNFTGDAGNFNGGWDLTITTATSVCSVVPPSLSIDDVTHNEGNSGATTYTFTVSLSKPAPAGGVTFDISTDNNSAIAPGDYIHNALSSQTIPEGSSTYTFDVQVNGDLLVEPTEVFNVRVSSVVGAIVSDGDGDGTITNDDIAIPTSLTLVSGTNPVCVGNTVTFTATLTRTSAPAGPLAGQTVTFSFTGPSSFSYVAMTDGSGNATITTPAFAIAGSYTVTASFANLAAGYDPSTDVLTQVVNAIPATPAAISAGGPTTFCLGGSVTLSTSGASSYQWYKNGSPIGGATFANYIATASGNYTVVAVSGGCVSPPTAAISVTAAPDVLAPVAPTLSDINSECSVTALTAPTATDNCVGIVTGTTTTTLPITVTTVVTWSFNDGNGNISTATQNVIINDVTAPVPPTSLPTINGGCFAIVTAPTALDNCAGTVTGTTTTPLPVTTPGTTTITWTFDDGHGNTSTATQTVNVVGPPPIVMSCPANITTGTTGNNCTATIFVPGPSATLSCESFASITWTMSGATTGSSPSTGLNSVGTKTFNPGVTSISYTVTSSLGNTASCSFTVTVADNQPPTLTCPASITQNVTGSACNRQIAVPNATVSDNCGTVSSLTWVMTGATTGSSVATGINNVGTKTFNVGVTTITYTAKDANGNTSTCTFTVTVKETVLPTITCPGNRTVNNDWGYCYFSSVNLAVPQVSDNCGIASLTHNAPAFLLPGATTVTWTVTDKSGNTRTCSQVITVVDAQNPEVTSPANINANTSGNCSAVVATPNPVYFDNCAVTRLTWVMTGATTGSSPATGFNNVGTKTFNVGLTTITYTVRDAAGRTASSYFSVIVSDNERPSLSCPSNISQTAANGSCSRSIAVPVPIYADNCGVTKVTWFMTGATSTSSSMSGINLIGTRSFNVGVTTVTYSIWDAANNTRSCTFTVTVTDNQAPVVTCPAGRTLCKKANNSYSVPAVVVSDNCGIASTTYAITGATTRSGTGLSASGIFNVGLSVITWTVTDFNGNVTTCSTNVTVVTSGNCTNAREAAPSNPVTLEEKAGGIVVEKIEAVAYPNPSGSFFNLQVRSNRKETVQITMYDMLGKVVEVQRGAPGHTYRFGEHVISGMYMIEVKQGGETAMVKVLKN